MWTTKKNRIWKRGSWLRVDSTIVGVGARFKLKRGRLSLVFMGKDSETPGVLLRVDHTKSKVLLLSISSVYTNVTAGIYDHTKSKVLLLLTVAAQLIVPGGSRMICMT